MKEKNKLVKQRKKCLNSTIPGSFSSCRAEQRVVSFYGEKCKVCEGTPAPASSASQTNYPITSTSIPPLLEIAILLPNDKTTSPINQPLSSSSPPLLLEIAILLPPISPPTSPEVGQQISTRAVRNWKDIIMSERLVHRMFK